ncbi:MAG: DHA2 family efflux MFS transporter permease subunit [Acidobacteriia bacterium]|nr:DHA2 family efflux MFS transporter permease subunit [Terriglobia bacterium]
MSDIRKPTTASASASPAARDSRPINPWFAALAVTPATLMEVLDSTVVNVSIPHIAGSMGVTNAEATWTMTTYLVANAIVLPMTGWLANYFGRRRLFIICLWSFTFASVLCGAAPSLGFMLFFRVLQGMSGGILVPIAQAIMLESFPPEKRGRAMAAFAIIIIFAPIVGPILGGFITDNYSWRWVFYINVPVGAFAFLLANALVFDPPYIRRKHNVIDYFGLALLAIGLGSLEIVLDNGELKDWFGSPFIRNFSFLAAAALVVFIFWELSTDHPVVDLHLLKDRNFSAGLLLMTTLGMVLYGSIVLQPIYLQTLMGYTALLSGLTLAPRGVTSLLFAPLAGRLTEKKDARWLIAFGVIMTSLTLWMMSHWNLQTDFRALMLPNLIQGAGIVFLFVPLTTATMAYISNENMGMASGLYNLMRNMGGSAGIAFVNTLLSRRLQFHHERLAEHITPYNPAMQQALHRLPTLLFQHGVPSGNTKALSYGMIHGELSRQAAMLAFIDNFWMLGLIFLIMLPLLLLMKKPPHQQIKAGH